MISDRPAAARSTLSPFEQTLLKLLSIIYEPANRSAILNCLHRADILGPEGSWLLLPALTPYLARLQKLGLIDHQLRCSAELCEQLSAAAASDGTYTAMARAVQEELPLALNYGNRTQRCWRLMRELRIGVYTYDIGHIENILPLLTAQCPQIIGTRFPLIQVCTQPFQTDWFRSLPTSTQFYFLDRILDHSLRHLAHFDEPVAYLQQAIEQDRIPLDERLPFHRLLVTYLLWRGELEKAREIMGRYRESFSASGLAGCLAFLSGKTDQAIREFQADLRRLQKATGNKNTYFCNLAGPLFILARLQSGASAGIDRLAGCISAAAEQCCDEILAAAYTALAAVLQARNNEVVETDSIIANLPFSDNSVALLFAALIYHWLNGEVPEEMTDLLQDHTKRATTHGFNLLAREYAELLARTTGDASAIGLAARLRQETGLISIIDIPKLQEPWQRSLRALLALSSSPEGARRETTGGKRRLVWLIGHDGERLSISPREQKYTSSQRWSKGRPVALSRLAAGKQPASMTEQDRRIAGAIRRKQATLSTEYYFDLDAAIPALVGHPLLFLEESPSIPVEFVKGDPELLVEEVGDRLQLTFINEITDSGPTVIRESRSRFRVIEMTDKCRRIAKIIGKNGLAVPLDAKARVLAAISNISAYMTVHSAIGGRPSYITEVEANSDIHVQLLPLGAGFRLEILVRPFKTGGPYLKPGKGVKTVIAEVDGQRLQTRRNLSLEEKKADAVVTACPTLAAERITNLIWYLPATEDCLQVLLELQGLQDKVVVEWPEGERLTVSHQASFRQLHLKIRKNRNWFEMSGRLQVDETLVLDMKKLMHLVRSSPKRFVPLGAGQFLALTRKFHSRLKELDLFSEKIPTGGREEAIRIDPLATLLLERFTEKLKSLDTDQGWQSQLQRIREARELTPRVPPTLRARLRDYQREGYIWLARLAHWGLGAILADDMGLGKTLQALAIMLDRAEHGPALVVAPTSVCMNWQEEAGRFAPALNVLNLESRDREQLVHGLRAHDVLIVSYTLLQQETKLLAVKEWETIVLDEAQAIKNMATKRSRAAMSLCGKFKLLTTGTPIENHLGELWNLFHFITPGLLGPLERFNKRFAIPIERHQSQEARKNLKKLIRPFILRRTKSQVLAELPPRTEIILHVEMDKEEAAFYEMLRRESLENLKDLQELPAGNSKGSGTGHNIRILAEIMKLRRACCNARLVAPEAAVPSAKLKHFTRVVADLKENRHQVLVFSQFVGHLAIIREQLDMEAISYRYLDGSTPVRKRQQEVEAFQAGKSDIFLISLKAGGLGLNLTAADYVIHMDPWWNPAVEDQASDRAHRIGQTRPVTIYRLVTKNTIEEKIVKLHQEKRDLANSLLEGTDISAAISATELLNLIREN